MNNIVQLEEVDLERSSDDVIKEMIDSAKLRMKALKQLVEEAEEVILNRYNKELLEGLKDKDDMTGTVNVGDVKLTVPKKVLWDQQKLAAMYSQDPDKAADFITVKYSVSESKYKTWTEETQKYFEPARTVTTGKTKVEFK